MYQKQYKQRTNGNNVDVMSLETKRLLCKALIYIEIYLANSIMFHVDS